MLHQPPRGLDGLPLVPRSKLSQMLANYKGLIVQSNEIRAFLPSKDYEESQSFYQAMGFRMEPASDDLSIFSNGTCTFFLQRYFNEEFAKNLMFQLIVPEIKEAFNVISNIEGFNIRYEPIKSEAWGKVIYLWGPSGELWHITELNK